MDKIEQLLEIGLSSEQADKAVKIFEEGSETEKLKGEIKRLSEINSKQKEDFKKQLNRRSVDINVLEELYKSGAKNPRFIMGAMGCGDLQLGENGEVLGLSDRVAALKKSDPYLFSDGMPVLTGFQPEQAGDFSPDGKGDLSDLTYSEMLEYLEESR